MKAPTSDFVQAALDLEEIFSGIEQLALSLDRLEPDSEPELERAKKLLVRFTEKSDGLQGGLEKLLRTLEGRRASVETAVGLVNVKAPLIGEKFRQAEEKITRFQALADQFQDFTEEAASLSTEEVRQRLEEMTAQAAALQEEARLGKLRTLEKNAQTLRSSLKELSRKFQ